MGGKTDGEGLALLQHRVKINDSFPYRIRISILLFKRSYSYSWKPKKKHFIPTLGNPIDCIVGWSDEDKREYGNAMG